MLMPPSIVANDYILMPETPLRYNTYAVAAFIEQEVQRPSKQWIASIIAGEQEREQVVLRTDEFVLLPDTERLNRYHTTATGVPSSLPCPPARPACHNQHQGKAITSPPQRMTLNWLSIVHDLRIRTLRDLRGEHLPMLQRMLSLAMAAIEEHTGIAAEQVMAYVHYPPSVYQLHVHFSYPYGQYCHRDTYRVHSLQAIINNLQVDPEYYAKATLLLAVYRHSPHYMALTANDELLLPVATPISCCDTDTHRKKPQQPHTAHTAERNSSSSSSGSNHVKHKKGRDLGLRPPPPTKTVEPASS